MGKRFNAPNDLCHRSQGPHLLHRPALSGRRAARAEAPGRVPHRHRAARSIEITHDVEKPNGIALSPDGKTLYVADHNNGTDRIDPTTPPPKPGAMKVYAFPLGADGLVAGQRRTLVDFGDRGRLRRHDGRRQGQPLPGRPQPEAARACWSSIRRARNWPSSPPARESEATRTRRRDCPATAIRHRRREQRLYVTVDMSLYRIRLKSRGYHRQFRDR